MVSASGASLVVLTLLVVSLLAGCTDDPPGVASPDDDPIVITDPADRSVFGDPALANRSHLHDYWGGSDALLIIEGERNSGATYSEPLAIATFRPEPNVVVPQGAATLNITLAWTDDYPLNAYSKAELWVKTANDTVPKSVREIANGETIEVASTNDDNDLPHQLLSAWIFQLVLYPPNGGGYMQYDGTVTATASAHRGLPIPIYPPHPDPWQGATEFLLFDDDFQTTLVAESDMLGGYCTDGCLYTHVADEGVIVPVDAAVVIVTLTQDAPAQIQMALRFHPSDSRDWVYPTPDEDTGTERTYRIVVTDGMGDGPYAKQSLWEFEVVPQQDAAPIGVYRGSYSVTATAYRAMP